MAMNQSQEYRQAAVRQAGRISAKFPASLVPALESIIGVALIVSVGLVLPAQEWGLLGITPHPLWIVVVAIAARYGRYPGYFAGAISAATYTALILSRRSVALASLDPQLLLQPLLMAIVGAALGEMTDARERRLAGLEDRSRHTESAMAKLLDRYRSLITVKDSLERRIAFAGRLSQKPSTRDLRPSTGQFTAQRADNSPMAER